jgi:hypothetical protein
MQLATSASGRKTRKGHTVGAVQPSTIFFNNGNSEDNTSRARLQFLSDRLGLTNSRATLIAALAWPIGGAA